MRICAALAYGFVTVSVTFGLSGGALVTIDSISHPPIPTTRPTSTPPKYPIGPPSDPSALADRVEYEYKGFTVQFDRDWFEVRRDTVERWIHVLKRQIDAAPRAFPPRDKRGHSTY
jgi:hypothetical protein